MKQARATLAVLTAMNLLNYLDRFLLPPVVPLIQKDLTLSDEAAGWVGSAFLLVYSIASPLFGRVGDYWKRPVLLCIGVSLWSLATASAGLAVGFLSLFIARAFVGVGEASYGTIAPAMIGDLYPPNRRERAMALFYVVVPIGAALGYILGSGISVAYGWRSAFFVVGLPGILVALLALRLPDPPRGALDGLDTPTKKESVPLSQVLQMLRKNHTYWYVLLGYIAYTFAIGGASYWLPTFVSRERGLPLNEANQSIGTIAAVGGIVGTLLGGFVSERLQGSVKNAGLFVAGLSVLLSAPFMWLTLQLTDFWVVRGVFLVSEILLFMCTGPIGAALVTSIPPNMRATGQAVAIFMIHIFGDVISPPILGTISTRWASLEVAMMTIPPVFAVGGLIWLLASRRLEDPNKAKL